MVTWLLNGELGFEPRSPSLRAPAPNHVQTVHPCTVDTGPGICLFCLEERKVGRNQFPDE